MLVIHDAGDDDLLVVPVTSQAWRSARDIFLNNWQQAGLRLPSVARVDKLATIEKGTVVRRLGKLSATDRDEVRTALSQFFQVTLEGW